MPRLSELTVEELVREAANRTYHLPSRSFYLNEIGAMIFPVPILRLDPSGIFRVRYLLSKNPLFKKCISCHIFQVLCSGHGSFFYLNILGTYATNSVLDHELLDCRRWWVSVSQTSRSVFQTLIWDGSVIPRFRVISLSVGYTAKSVFPEKILVRTKEYYTLVCLVFGYVMTSVEFPCRDNQHCFTRIGGSGNGNDKSSCFLSSVCWGNFIEFSPLWVPIKNIFLFSTSPKLCTILTLPSKFNSGKKVPMTICCSFWSMRRKFNCLLQP